MSIDTSAIARLNQSSQSGNLRGQVARRTGTDGYNAVFRQEVSGQTHFRDVLTQSFTQLAAHHATSDQGATGGTSGSQNMVSDQALAKFVQDLLAALAGNAGNSAGMPLTSEGPDLTKEGLASSLEEAQSANNNRYDRNLALLNNFDTADMDGDGAISHAEAQAFNEANSIPTIENGETVPPHVASLSQAYQPSFASQMAANLQDLIQLVASVNESKSNNSPAATDGSMPSMSNPFLSALETSYDNLASAFSGESSTGSLANFLEALKFNLGPVEASGNVVNTTA